CPTTGGVGALSDGAQRRLADVHAAQRSPRAADRAGTARGGAATGGAADRLESRSCRGPRGGPLVAGAAAIAFMEPPVADVSAHRTSMRLIPLRSDARRRSRAGEAMLLPPLPPLRDRRGQFCRIGGPFFRRLALVGPCEPSQSPC